MKSIMKKTTLREIRQSLGRYLAIFAIVAMGVGFFAGLKITRQVMITSANAYLEEKQLYDFRLLSTLGFEDEDVQTLSSKEDVRFVEGAVAADILYFNQQGNEDVIKAHSLLQNINGLEVVAGRLPQQATECVVDANLYDKSALGTKIVLSENNVEEDLDYFAYREYTIVGIAQSSAYIQFERGTTALGNGQVSGFMYLLPQGFCAEFYTEIYVKFNQDYPIYSKDYNDYIDEKEPLWKDYCKAQGERRYQAIVADAEAELANAKQTLAEEKADAKQTLADAKRNLQTHTLSLRTAGQNTMTLMPNLKKKLRRQNRKLQTQKRILPILKSQKLMFLIVIPISVMPAFKMIPALWKGLQMYFPFSSFWWQRWYV